MVVGRGWATAAGGVTKSPARFFLGKNVAVRSFRCPGTVTAGFLAGKNGKEEGRPVETGPGSNVEKPAA